MAKRGRKSKAEIERDRAILKGIMFVIAIIVFWQALKSGETWAIIALVVFVLFLIGTMLLYFKIKRNKLRYEQSIDLLTIDKMSGHEFEEYIANLFRRDGYKTEVTKKASDYGADVLMTKDEKTIVIQVKRYNKAVGFAAIKEIFTAKQFYKADEAWVITNNISFTRNALKASKHNDVRLINRIDLYKIIKRINNKK